MAPLKVALASWLAAVAAIPIWDALGAVYGLEGVEGVAASLATIVGSLVIVGGAGVRFWRGFRKAERAVTTILGLDTKLDDHRRESKAQWESTDHRLVEGEKRMVRIEATMDTWVDAERAAITGAIGAIRGAPVRPGEHPPPAVPSRRKDDR